MELGPNWLRHAALAHPCASRHKYIPVQKKTANNVGGNLQHTQSGENLIVM